MVSGLGRVGVGRFEGVGLMSYDTNWPVSY